MKKILVHVGVPVISGSYDILLPEDLPVRELTPLIAQAVEDLSDHLYPISGGEFLCSGDKRLLLREDETLGSSCLQNGDSLLLI